MKTHISRILRKNQTPWETKLWRVIRSRQLNRLKFRRQHKVGRHVVDFCCIECRIVIELDGGHHNEDNQMNIDIKRQNFIERQGFTVLRFWNSDIDENLEGVVEAIKQAVSPHPINLK